MQVPSSKEALKERLSRYRQIKISVIGRKSGQKISIPVWFVLEGGKLYLLPVHGSETQWFRNVLKNPTIRIDARGVEVEFRATPVTDVTGCEIRDPEIPGEIRRGRCEEVLFETRCGGSGCARLTRLTSKS